jgi:hypothetical protein
MTNSPSRWPKPRHFLRNSRAEDYLELFLVSGITSLLGVRLFLHITGYPQVSGGSLHIAHMLWGGALMVAAIILAVTYLGSRALRASAIIGGLGFGIFIDELGKFLTRDNNYFFRPTIALIYATFIIVFLVGRSISRKRPLTSQEYLLNALAMLEEAVRHDLDAGEKQQIQYYLQKAAADHALADDLNKVLADMQPIVLHRQSLGDKIKRRLADLYRTLAQIPVVNSLINFFFLAETAIVLLTISFLVYDNVRDVFEKSTPLTSVPVLISVGQLASALVAAVFVILGVVAIRTSRLRAYDFFLRATLVNIFLTSFFSFYREQFGALPGFAINLLIFAALRYALQQEQEHANKSDDE